MGLSKILGGCWFLTYLALAVGSPKFQSMADPPLAPNTSSVKSPLLVEGGSGGGRGIRAFVHRRLRAIVGSRGRRQDARLKATNHADVGDAGCAGVTNDDTDRVNPRVRRRRKATENATFYGKNVVGGRRAVSVLRASL